MIAIALLVMSLLDGKAAAAPPSVHRIAPEFRPADLTMQASTFARERVRLRAQMEVTRP